MKRPVLSTIAALGLASSAAVVLPASANAMGTGNHSGVGNVFVACTLSTTTPFLSFSVLQASGIAINTPTGGFKTCADAVAAVEAAGLHVVAEETAVVDSIPRLIIHLDNTNPGGNTGGNTNTGGHTGHNTGSNTGP